MCAVLPCCCRCQIESTDDDQSRERPARISWRRLVLPRGWSTASRTEGGIGGKRRVPSFPSLPFPCLALPGLPALSWLGFDLERGKEQGGRGCGCTVHATGAMQCNLRMDGLLYIGWLQVLLAALILFGGQQAGTHTHFLTHTAQRRARGHGGRRRRRMRSSKACRRGRKA